MAANLDISSFITLVLELVGGLGLFLLGMKHMSEGMQAVAGNSLRRIISAVSTNRLLATTCGILVTCIVQSSSITTVMVVGFVNSGVMTLAQAIGIIMGANIGTTITGWILVLKVGKYGLPILGFSAFVYLFSKKDRTRYWAMAIMGIGMIFFGLELMKDACGLIKEMPQFENWFLQFQADSYLGVLKCALVGCLLTVMVQSSSATLGITISLAFQGVIPFETAAALVLGENIGTTITAFLASLGATTNARRAAYFHIVFNLIGVFWITLIFAWYIELIHWLAGGNVSEAVVVDGVTSYPNTTLAIAMTHSVFNITNTLMFIPLLPWFVKFLERVVPAKDFKEKPRLTDLEMRVARTPALAIQQSRVEIEKMGDGCEKMLTWLSELMEQDDPDRALADRLTRREQVLNSMQDEVSEFVTELLSGNVPYSIADEACRQLRMVNEYEAMSDDIVNLDKFDRKLRRKGSRFSEEQREGLGFLNKQIAELLRIVNLALQQNNRNVPTQITALADRVKKDVKQLRRKHLSNLLNDKIEPQVSVAFLSALNAYSRLRDHTINIAESIAGEK